jgi:internalin A
MNKLLVPLLTLSLVATMLPVRLSFAQAQPESKPAETSIFKDKKLEEAVRQYVFEKRNTTKPITAADVANLSVIKAKGAGITDLSGLEHCRKLASLELADNQIKDLTPIKGLAMIQLLDLANNQVQDISPLAGVSALQYVELTGNQVKDLKPLSTLTNLASVYLSNNQIADISPLFGLPRLTSLYLDQNQISSIAGINNLKRLSSLSLSRNQIADVSPLNGLTGLYHLFLEDNRISDLAPLYEMAKKDHDGEKRFSPFINLYLKGNPLKASARTQLSGLKDFGARVYN